MSLHNYLRHERKTEKGESKSFCVTTQKERVGQPFSSSRGIVFGKPLQQTALQTPQLVPLQVTGTQIQRDDIGCPSTRTFEHGTSNASRMQLPRLEQRPSMRRSFSLNLPPHASSKPSFCVPNPLGAIRHANEYSSNGVFVGPHENLPHRNDLGSVSSSALNPEDQRLLKTFSVKCLPSTNVKLPSKSRPANNRPSTSKKYLASILPILQTGDNVVKSSSPESICAKELKEVTASCNGDLYLNRSLNSIKSSVCVCPVPEDGTTKELENERENMLPYSVAVVHEDCLRKLHEKPIASCVISDTANESNDKNIEEKDHYSTMSEEYVGKLLNETMAAVQVREAFHEVWPDVLHSVVEEVLNDFQNMELHMKACMKQLNDKL